MTDAPQKTDVHIDRLVLDIPGLDPSQGRALALGIAEGLAKAGASGEHKSVSVPLASGNLPPAELTARIVAALLQRLV